MRNDVLIDAKFGLLYKNRKTGTALVISNFQRYRYLGGAHSKNQTIDS